MLLDIDERNVTPSSLMPVIFEGMTSPLRRKSDRCSTAASAVGVLVVPRLERTAFGLATIRRAWIAAVTRSVVGGESRKTILPAAPGRNGLPVSLPEGRHVRQLTSGPSRPSTSRPGKRTPGISSLAVADEAASAASWLRTTRARNPAIGSRRASLIPGTVMSRRPASTLVGLAADPGAVLIHGADHPYRLIPGGGQEHAGDLALGDRASPFGVLTISSFEPAS